jgi:UPF0176 protein
MFQIKNKLDKASCLQLLNAEGFERTTLSFYRYVKLEDPRVLRDVLFKEWTEIGVLGRVYLSEEGVNAQICVPSDKMDDFRANLNSREAFKDLFLNVAVEHQYSFHKLTMKVKEQIVADGLDVHSYDLQNPGEHLNAQQFNDAMDEGAIVVDMRNFYESRIGHFEGAICPDVDTFKEELPKVVEELKDKKDQKIVMYCTGGIRCEKASAYLKHNGFEDVSQLQGGIINYAHTVKEKGLENKFKGSNFVFDERLAERISDEVLADCDQCESACDSYTNCSNKACNLLFIQCEGCAEKWDGACDEECRAIALLPKAEQKIEFLKWTEKHEKSASSRIRPNLKA